jgi:hypothetical protein
MGGTDGRDMLVAGAELAPKGCLDLLPGTLRILDSRAPLLRRVEDPVALALRGRADDDLLVSCDELLSGAHLLGQLGDLRL